MTTLALATLILTIAFALVFDLANGWNDAANAVATVISTRVLRPATAIVFGAVLNFVGALFSSEVARTVGHNIAEPEFLYVPGALEGGVGMNPRRHSRGQLRNPG